MTVNSHWLACLLAQGTQQHCKVSTTSWQNSPFICNSSSRVFARPTDFAKRSGVFWSNTGKRPSKRKVKAGLTGAIRGNGPAFIQHLSLCTILLCVKDACTSTGGDPSRGFYTKPLKDLSCQSSPSVRPPSTQPLIWGERCYRKNEMPWKSPTTSHKVTSNDNS